MMRKLVVGVGVLELDSCREGRRCQAEMPRTKSSPLKCVASGNGHSKNWVLILHNDLLSIDEGESRTPDIVKLRHPRSGGGAMFLFSADNSVVQEVFSLSEKRSWFINDSVAESGRMHFSTPVDPLFLVLPYLKKTKEEGKVVPLEDLLIDDVFPETLRLLKSSVKEHIHLLADKKGSEDLNAWMYNEEKTLKWLCKKTEKVAEILKEKQINVGGNATSKHFVKSVKEDFASDRECYLKYAYGLVAEYLTEDLSLKLSSSLKLPEEIENKGGNKRKPSAAEEQGSSKKIKREEEALVAGEGPKEDKRKPLSSKEKALKRAA